MRKKNVKLEWYVINYNQSNRKIERYNIFYKGFIDELDCRIKKAKVNNLTDFKKIIDSWAKYNYWSKTECEILAGGLFVEDFNEFQKIDIYYQIELNIDHIVDYLVKELKIKFENRV